MLGCKSSGFITNVRTEPDFNNQIHEITDIFILGNLVVKFHEENRIWPERITDLNIADDTLKLFLANFDTINLIISNDRSIQVDYKFSKDRELMTPIEFIHPDSVTEEPKHIIWPELDNSKFRNNEFDGTLTINYDEGLYHINKDPAKDEHSR